MPVTTTVPTSSLEFGNRIDAELYRPALRKSFETLFKTGFAVRRLGRVCTIRSGTTPPDRVDGLKTGPILLKTTDIRNGVLSSEGDYYRITDQVHHRMAKTRLEDRDVLLNIVGATLDVIGRTAFVVGLQDEANITQAMVLLRCTTPEILPDYLFAYLNTRFGQDQIARYARPTGQYNLNLYEVGHIAIPLLPPLEQEAIEQLLVSAARLKKASISGHSEAQQRLESELGLDKLTIKKPVGYTAQFSEVERSLRIDPEHFSPAFKSFKTSLPTRISLSPLGPILNFCRRGKPPIYAKAGLPVINSRHVHPNGVIRDDKRVALASLDTDFQVQRGDTLLNSTGRGTLGRAAPYLNEERAVPDNHIMILRSSCLDAVFLSLYLNSAAGQMQVAMHQRGSSGQVELYPFDVRKFLVWPAPPEVQKELSDLYERAANAEAESRRFLEQAKARVEQLIKEAVHS